MQNNANAPKLQRVVRFDNLPLNQTYFTEEGYLMDHPIVTTVGIFEYLNEDGSIRKELRLPEEVFSEKSLASYKGKPVIITHDAGVVNKDNVNSEHIGTILSKGYKDGESVRAEIVIHETDKLRACGLRELSLGYNLTLDETPGEWNGQHYDAIQRNIEINHLALVGSARAGETARLNIDGKSKSEGGTTMKKKTRLDSDTMAPDALAEAIEKYKSRRNARSGAADNSEGEDKPVDAPATPIAANDNEGGDAEPTTTDKVQMVKDRRDRRDSDGDPEDLDKAMGVIAQQDEDIDSLLGIIEEMTAKQDFDSADDGSDDDTNADGDDDNSDCDNNDGDESKSANLNMDSVDKLVSQKLALCRLGDALRMDGIEGMSIPEAKKAIIRKVKPSIRLDGKSNSYIDAMFDIVKSSVTEKKSTDGQRAQMFNADGRSKVQPMGESSASQARARMIERQNGGNK